LAVYVATSHNQISPFGNSIISGIPRRIMENEFDLFRKNPPRDIRECFRRLDVCEGVPFGALASELEKKSFQQLWSRKGPASVKSWHAVVVEALMGKSPDNKKDRDLDFAEIKIIPINNPKVNARIMKHWPVPKEATKLCYFCYDEVLQTEFVNSSVFRKLSSILFVPVMWGKTNKRSPEDYYSMFMSNSFMWVPNVKMISQLRTEYDEIRAHLAAKVSKGEWTTEDGRIEVQFPKKGESVLFQKSGGGQKGSDSSKITINGRKYNAKKKTWWISKKFTYDLMQYVMFNRVQEQINTQYAMRSEN
jgi:DNA mismatch repair protein MutH